MFSCCLRVISRRYHIHHLMTSRKDGVYIKLHPSLMKMYYQSFFQEPFCQKKALILLTDAVRSTQSVEYVKEIVNRIGTHTEQLQSITSIVGMLTQMCNYKIQDKDLAKKLISKAFSIIPLLELEENSFFSFNYSKLLIATDLLIGLNTFSNEEYRKLPFNYFKPLHLCFVIELFHMRGIQKDYPIIEELIGIFIKCEAFVPFADLHHIRYATKVINNQKFKDCVARINSRIIGNLDTPQVPEIKIKQHQLNRMRQQSSLKCFSQAKNQNAKTSNTKNPFDSSKIYMEDLRQKYSLH